MLTGCPNKICDNQWKYLQKQSFHFQFRHLTHLAVPLGATTGVATTVGTVAVKMLMAISCGAVFMGANTYIGNAPNFMVKSISDENGIKMPSFFGYMLCSLKFLIPVFIIDTLVFFL